MQHKTKSPQHSSWQRKKKNPKTQREPEKNTGNQAALNKNQFEPLLNEKRNNKIKNLPEFNENESITHPNLQDTLKVVLRKSSQH